MESKKNDNNELIYKTEKESQMLKKKNTVTKGKSGEGINWEIRIDIYTLLYIKEITNKDLL